MADGFNSRLVDGHDFPREWYSPQGTNCIHTHSGLEHRGQFDFLDFFEVFRKAVYRPQSGQRGLTGVRHAPGVSWSKLKGAFRFYDMAIVFV